METGLYLYKDKKVVESQNVDQLQLFRSDNSIMSSDIKVTKHLKEKMKHFEFCVSFLLMLNIRLS